MTNELGAVIGLTAAVALLIPFLIAGGTSDRQRVPLIPNILPLP